MRRVVHGQQAIGKAVLEALLERGHEVVAVYVEPRSRAQVMRVRPAGGAKMPAGDFAEGAGIIPGARLW
jgi:methionyl-tRNA formyltransferase